MNDRMNSTVKAPSASFGYHSFLLWPKMEWIWSILYTICNKFTLDSSQLIPARRDSLERLCWRETQSLKHANVWNLMALCVIQTLTLFPTMVWTPIVVYRDQNLILNPDLPSGFLMMTSEIETCLIFVVEEWPSSCVSAQWHHSNLITDGDRLCSVYLAITSESAPRGFPRIFPSWQPAGSSGG